jgi:nicotinamide-nucleotide amidase
MVRVETLLLPDQSDHLLSLSKRILDSLRRKQIRLITAESCTGGLVAAALTHHAGSSDVTEGGFVTYSNAMKNRVLGVSAETLASFGAVSQETVREMAEGALRQAPEASVAISVSGIAGPGGGSDRKPVGTVWFATAVKDKETYAEMRLFPGDRTTVRTLAAEHALLLVQKRLET